MVSLELRPLVAPIAAPLLSILSVVAACSGDSMETGTFTASATVATTEETMSAGSTATSTTSSESTTSATTTTTTTTTTSSETTTGETTTPTTSTTTTTTTTTTTGDTTTGEEVCAAPGNLVVCDLGLDGSKTDDAFAALGVGCKGAPQNTIPISNKTFKKFQQWTNPASWRVAAVFGSADDPKDPGKKLFRAREGERFLIVSTGKLAEPDGDGVLLEVPGSQYANDNNSNDDADALPPPLSPLVGSNNGMGGAPFTGCDGQNDCSDSIWPNWSLGNQDPNDLLSLSFDVSVPEGVHGFLFDFVFFSSEYPEFVGKKFNDMFIAWSTSEAYTGNVTFFEGQPLTVTSLATAMEAAGYTLDDPELAETGFEGHGSTGWATVEASVDPFETFTFAIAIMDMGDSNKATTAILDRWRWDCAGCVQKGDDPECGKADHPPCCGVCVEIEDDPACGSPGHPLCCPEPE